MIKILLTGATGFIGRHVLEELAAQKYSVLAPVRNIKVIKKFTNYKNVNFLMGNFYDYNLFQEYKNFSPDVIVHLAAIRGEGKGKWKEYYKVNVQGTERLVQFALRHNVSRLIYSSTVGIYGTIPSHLPADPCTPANPDGNYHYSKFMAEKYIISQLKGKIPYIIFRPTIIYGLGDNGFLDKLIRMVRAHYFPLVSRDILIHLVNIATVKEFVSKVIQNNVHVLDCIVNLGDKESISLTKLVNLIHQYFYNKPYPKRIKIPSYIFKMAAKICHTASIQISLKLISHSWYYDVSHFERICDCELKDTLKSVQIYLMETYPKDVST